MLSAITAPSAGTLQNLYTFLVRVPALGAAMVESAVSEGDKDFQQTVAGDARRASRARRTQGALWCDFATVLLRNIRIKEYHLTTEKY